MRRTTSRLTAVLVLGFAFLSAGPALTGPAVPEGEPTHEEQFMLEIIQRTRLDPDGEATKFKIDLNEGLDPGTLKSDPREPLAFNFEVMKAARLHNADLLANFDDLPPDHRGSDGKDPTGRVAATDAVFDGGVSENNAWTTVSGTKVDTASVKAMHRLLFKDFTKTFEVVGRGHRKNLLTTTKNEVGIGLAGGKLGSKSVALSTQDFIQSNRVCLVGVVFKDNKEKDDFYTVGEGIGGVTITARRTSDSAEFTTTTWSAGGYNLELPDGTYDVTASGESFGTASTTTGVVVAGRNVKVDFEPLPPPPPPPPPPPDPHFELVKAAGKLSKKTALWSLQVKKATLNHGAWTFTRPILDVLELRVNGVTYFDPATRTADIVKEKVDKKTGEVVKITIKQESGHKFTWDLKRSRLKVKLKDAASFDPTTGPVRIQVRIGDETADVTVDATIEGKKLNRALLAPGIGTIDD